MTLCLDLREIQDRHAPCAGGKAAALARLLQHDFPVPDGLCILTDAYRLFVDRSALAERIRLELSRKQFHHMRWEELWDAALRIRHLFSRTDFPPDVERTLTQHIEQAVGEGPAAVRSSAIGEDSGELSFAGLHESVINVLGTANILEQVKTVWASLWSDAALLYRQELGLEVERSAMAVVVQRFVPGECSGVVFSRSPLDPEVAVIEAVSGLAKGLVDGTVEPERWEIERSGTRIRSHRSSAENRRVVAASEGTRIVQEKDGAVASLLTDRQIQEVYSAALEAERLFGSPQDVEWTFGSAGLQILQARPVTAGKQDGDEKRIWNLSLRRSYENLETLRAKIESSILPGMEQEADELSKKNLEDCSDIELAGLLEQRQEVLDRWTDVYWDDLIPFAHGMRLFGQVYNDAVRPEDPFAFVALLRPKRLESVERNRLIRGMAERIRSQPRLRKGLADRPLSRCDDGQLLSMLEEYHFRYGNLLGISADRDRLEEYLRTLLLEMSDPGRPLNVEQRPEDLEQMEKRYLAAYRKEDRAHARDLLELGRASYRIRDDDNIYLDRFKGLVREAEETARERLHERGVNTAGRFSGEELARALREPGYQPLVAEHEAPEAGPAAVDARQLLGQPASHGIATGRARVVRRPEQLFSLQKGEVLVCDAIDPAMTFVAPLAAAIVERRGGMLIHGAIIAREYGIPCVTGIPEATERITSGDRLTVDGYLGIVVIDSRS
jgi:pyruvate,water dikinase